MADGISAPAEVLPPPSPRKYWTRRGVAEWLVERLSEEQLTLVGIDHGFSFPLRYFEEYGLQHDWQVFLDDFQQPRWFALVAFSPKACERPGSFLAI